VKAHLPLCPFRYLRGFYINILQPVSDGGAGAADSAPGVKMSVEDYQHHEFTAGKVTENALFCNVTFCDHGYCASVI